MQHTCDICKKESNCFTGSFFNTDVICMECKARERNHRGFNKAKEAEVEHIMAGNYNFEGIGLPQDLKDYYENM